MKEKLGTTGLVMNEPLLWEKGGKGRCGFSMPRRDVEASPIDKNLVGPVPDFPELSEVDVVRHYTRLSQWNYGVDTGMYPLGSCTMKYNPKVNERYASLPGFAGSHPLLPPSMIQGALKLMYDLERFLSEITGMDATTLQPAAGAQGELTGTMLIYAVLRSKEDHRSKFLIPDTAHPVKSNEDGILAPEAVAEAMDEDVAGILVTNPNTLGLFEENIRKISEIVHGKGGLVYCDGANMNAVMGIVEMGKIGVDVMHVNLHKTFSTPHGGGGPGSGPVSVKKHLEPFLPVPRVVQQDGSYGLSSDYPQSIGKVHGFYGNFGVMVKAYSYIMSMGPGDLKKASQLAVLNANYIKESLKTVFTLPYDRPCMHECVFSDKKQNEHKITTLDMAKRLIDWGFHPPTIYFPLVVAGAIMVEPTESESKETLDQFIETCKAIANEAEEDPDVLHEAPKNAKVRRLDEVTAARQPCLID
jgi:glycine dehydrogenase subunit 2